ncbi:unnamed protein product [Calypogeia fissa]
MTRAELGYFTMPAGTPGRGVVRAGQASGRSSIAISYGTGSGASLITCSILQYPTTRQGSVQKTFRGSIGAREAGWRGGPEWSGRDAESEPEDRKQGEQWAHGPV